MPISDLLASITGEQPSSQVYTPPPRQKRKADSDLRSTNDKLVRRDATPTTSDRLVAPAKRSSTVNTAIKAVPNPAVKSLALELPPTSRGSRASSALATSSIPSKAPKKGSFAEIMARGKAATATMGQVGKIQHKRIEKLPGKREREEEKKSQKSGTTQLSNGRPRPGIPGQQAPRDGKSGTKESGKATGKVDSEKKIKKAALATTGYTGTARPIPGKSIPGLAPRPGGSSHRERDRPRAGHSRKDEYLGTDDEEDDMEDEEEGDYYSDASSDMEAATFEVDEEEERATRIARKEDAEALAEENRLKRQKEEKRKRLAAMAKSRR